MKVCGIAELLPKPYILSSSHLVVTIPSASGPGYRGTLEGSDVRVVRLRFYPENNAQKAKEVRPQ